MDIISSLTDELLLKILVLVPTKDAVSTSILSKRWEYPWMLLPKLEYGSRYCSESEWEKLRCFLDRNLPLHRAPVIESLRLELFSSCFKPENVTMWVVIAVSHCLRELEILDKSYNPAKPVILPSNLYTCKSLVILKLDGGFLLDVPRMVSLPSLKTLELQKVRYFREETLQRLLSSCPILEDLLVYLRGNDTTQKLTVVVPSLLSFSLYMPYNHNIDGLVMKTPNLKYFKSYNIKCQYCLIETMPNLIEADLDHVDNPDMKSIIGSITSVKRLSICSQTILDEGFVFNQLERLELCICKAHSSNQLVRLLNASPKLKELDFSYMMWHGSQVMDYWKEPSTVPECMLSSLQSLSWSRYTGEPQERDIVIYILQHAVHLKTATIKSVEISVPKFEMLKELALSSRASPACQLMFECVF